MKKILAIIIALSVIIAGVLAFLYLRSGGSGGTLPEQSPAPETQLNEGGQDTALEHMPALQEIDKEAIYRLHSPDETVASVDGRDISWAEYFGWYNNIMIQIQNYMNQMSSYGSAVSWSDPAGGSDSFAASAIKQTESQLKYFAAMEELAEASKISLTDGNKKEIASQLETDIKSLAGENATEQDFNDYLSTMYLPRDCYDRLIRDNVLLAQCHREKYGENGSKLSDADTLAWLGEKGYMAANHILFMTIDSATGKSVDDAAKNDKKALAEKTAAELKTVEKDEDRLQKFLSMKKELDEDTGKTLYPEGYTFTPNTMVPEFEKTAKSLKPYEVSDPVETKYGYHVLMGLPLDPDAVIQASPDGTTFTARARCADEKFSAELDKVFNQVKLSYAEGFTAPSVLDYIK